MDRISTGIKGLDEIIYGGLIKERSYLIRGDAGAGKTTLGFHFLQNGIENGEKCLFITMGESIESLRENALNIGISLENVEFLDLSLGEGLFKNINTYDFFISSEVETGPITRKILDTMKKVKPGRVFLDSISMLQYLLNDAYQLRKQVLFFIEYINKHSATFVFTSEPTKNTPDEQVRFLADGVINLEMEADSRYITISKFRGSEFRTGRHAFRLTGKGLVIYPRLIPGEHHRILPDLTMSSGVAGIDKLLGGGIERGTVTIITGPSGIGKTTLGLQFMNEAARNGDRSVIYLFEESKELLIKQSEGINIPTGSMIKGENLSVVRVEPLRYSSDEFAIMVRNEIEEKGAKIVMIDSVAGLILSIRDESVIERLHAIATYLRNMGATLFFINEIENLTGDFRATELNYSYLSDNIIFMKYVELQGELRRVIGVLKKRLGNFEKSIREFQITQNGLTVGEPLYDMKGILSGNPEMNKNNNEKQ